MTEFTELMRAYHARVQRFGLRACPDASDADDAVQEAFVKLSRRPDVVAHPGALSWLMTVVRRACLRLLRRDPDALALPPAEPQDPHQALERWERVRAVHEALQTLETPYREVLELRDLQGLSGEQTCEALGLPLPAMKSRLHRARAQLRAELLRASSSTREARGAP